MDYKQIETFLQVIRDRNMTKAAEKLFITQSTVSYRIKTLEEELGFALIERKKGTSSVVITDGGKQFIPIAEDWLNVYERINELCRRQTVVKLRIAAPDSIHYYFRSRYKQIREDDNVKLSLITCNSDQIATLLKSGQADLGFSFLKNRDSELLLDIEESFPFVVFIRTDGELECEGDIRLLDPHKMIQVKGVGTDNPGAKDLFKEVFDNIPEPIAQYDSLSAIVNNAEESSQ